MHIWNSSWICTYAYVMCSIAVYSFKYCEMTFLFLNLVIHGAKLLWGGTCLYSTSYSWNRIHQTFNSSFWGPRSFAPFGFVRFLSLYTSNTRRMQSWFCTNQPTTAVIVMPTTLIKLEWGLCLGGSFSGGPPCPPFSPVPSHVCCWDAGYSHLPEKGFRLLRNVLS